MIDTINGKMPISEIIPGDVLKNNDIVTSTLNFHLKISCFILSIILL